MRAILFFGLVCLTIANNVVKTDVHFHFKGLVNSVAKPKTLEENPTSVLPPSPGDNSNGEFTLVTEPFPYYNRDLDRQFEGFLAYEKRNTQAARPAIIVIPDFLNIEEDHRERARQLAQLGFITFVADLYGDGQFYSRDTREQITMAYGMAAEQKAGTHYLQIMSNLIANVAGHPMVDVSRIGVLGFGFGGTYALDLLRTGDSRLQAFSSYYPNALTAGVPQATFYKGTGQLNMGAADPLFDGAEAFLDELDEKQLSLFDVHAGLRVVSCFTDTLADLLSRNAPDIFDPRTCKYDAPVAKRYWANTKSWFKEILMG